MNSKNKIDCDINFYASTEQDYPLGIYRHSAYIVYEKNVAYTKRKCLKFWLHRVT